MLVLLRGTFVNRDSISNVTNSYPSSNISDGTDLILLAAVKRIFKSVIIYSEQL